MDRVSAVVGGVLSMAAGVLAVVTVFWHDWIEAVTGWDPDHHSGVFEVVVVVGLAFVCVALGMVARQGWRRLATN